MGGKSQQFIQQQGHRDDNLYDEEGSDPSERHSDIQDQFDDPLVNDRPIEGTSQDSPAVEFGGLASYMPFVDTSTIAADSQTEASQFPEGHVVQASDITGFILCKTKQVHVSQLQWDKSTALGQIRSLNSNLVQHYTKRLKATPPRRMIRILAKATNGMICVFADTALILAFTQTDITYQSVDNTSAQHSSLSSSPWVAMTKTSEFLRSCNLWMLKS